MPLCEHPVVEMPCNDLVPAVLWLASRLSETLISGGAATRFQPKLQGVTFHDMTGSPFDMLATETDFELARAFTTI